MPSWGSMPGRFVNQPRRSSSEYQTYYRDPITRKFVAIDGLMVKVKFRFDVDPPKGVSLKQETTPKLRDGIPSLSYRGNPIWPK
jgi:hypothetical protein